MNKKATDIERLRALISDKISTMTPKELQQLESFIQKKLNEIIE